MDVNNVSQPNKVDNLNHPFPINVIPKREENQEKIQSAVLKQNLEIEKEKGDALVNMMEGKGSQLDKIS